MLNLWNNLLNLFSIDDDEADFVRFLNSGENHLEVEDLGGGSFVIRNKNQTLTPQEQEGYRLAHKIVNPNPDDVADLSSE